MQLTIPDFAFVALIGASGSGKSTFAARNFRETEVISSDRCRALVADDESDQSATKDAFEILYTIAAKRLAARRMTVVDATNLRPEDRANGIAVARKFHALPVAIVLDVPPQISVERNRDRPNRNFGARVVHNQVRLLRQSLKHLRREGYRVIHVLDRPEIIDTISIVREPLYNDKRDQHGPFDIIGDVHGCYDELVVLLEKLGYVEGAAGNGDRSVRRHPHGRRAVFLGDLVDRGRGVVPVLRLVMDMIADGAALCVPGNHENKLARKLSGRNVTVSWGLAETLAQFDALGDAERESFKAEVSAFIDRLVSHYWLDDGKLVVAHAGLREEMHGRGSAEVREFALYGQTTGETDEFGLPVRYDWAAEYRGTAAVVYGHTPVPRAEWVNNTICVDTGCVYGGALTALRYPELELVDVAAQRVYVEPVRPLVVPEVHEPSAQQQADDLLDIRDVAGKRRIETRYASAVRIAEEDAMAALEVMSRFCVDPRWLIYLPPTMSPSETSKRETLLEHPDEALSYYRRAGVERVVLEEKHMGSRAVIVLARDEAAAADRFGVETERGVIFTRTGRAFFSGAEAHMSIALLDRLGTALDRVGFWTKFETNWLCLDAELLPWSAKAQILVDKQYAPVGEAAAAGLAASEVALQAALDRGVDTSELLANMRLRRAAAQAYVDAFRRYVAPVHSVDDLTLAPFHLLATEGAVYADRDHLWHLRVLADICAADPGLLRATAHREVVLEDEQQTVEAVRWWTELTEHGGEGIVVKPLDFVVRTARGLLQPAIKVRGPEYLRIIYGPEYRLAQHLARLRERGLSTKRKLALMEFSLGLESLHRFVERAPLRAVHECVFGLLALESEVVDPRL